MTGRSPDEELDHAERIALATVRSARRIDRLEEGGADDDDEDGLGPNDVAHSLDLGALGDIQLGGSGGASNGDAAAAHVQAELDT